MTTDQRLSERVPVDIPARIHCQNGQIGNVRVKDINIRGLSIQADGVPLTPGALPSVQIDLDDRTWKLPAIVVHRHGDRCGMMILSLEQNLYLYGAMLEKAASNS